MPEPVHSAPIAHTVRTLVVCTANQCRSPMAAALLVHRLSMAHMEASVISAGIRESRAAPATQETIAAMAAHGLDLSGHRSRPVEPDLVNAADLIIGMTREHVREVVVREPSALARSFTLKELVRRGEEQPRRERPLAIWLASLVGDRELTDLLGSSPLDDVDDPIAGGPKAIRATAIELDGLVNRLVEIVWPSW